MYFLALAALLALNQYAPKIIAPPVDLAECEKAASVKNMQEKDNLAADEMQAVGARYVCFLLVLPSV